MRSGNSVCKLVLLLISFFQTFGIVFTMAMGLLMSSVGVRNGNIAISVALFLGAIGTGGYLLTCNECIFGESGEEAKCKIRTGITSIFLKKQLPDCHG